MVHYLYTSRRFDLFIIDIILQNVDKRPSANKPFGGYSSVGRALAWHARGQRFDSAYLHHFF
jgi:hypothetical protein